MKGVDPGVGTGVAEVPGVTVGTAAGGGGAANVGAGVA